MQNRYKGSCLCTSVQYELVGEFESFFLCYCSRCQKDTGSAHAANLFTDFSKLTWIKGNSSVKTYQHPNSQHVKSFCENCGSAVPTVTNSSGIILVPAGSLDSPVSISPTARIFIGSCASWSKDVDSLLSFEKLPE